MMTDNDLIHAAENQLPPISIADACAKYGIPRATLIGRVLRGDIGDPVRVSGDASKPDAVMIGDDHRLWALKSTTSSDGQTVK